VAKIFVSHAGEDRVLAGELHQRLTDDGHEAFLDQDLRDGIVVGEEWEQRLYERLRWADAVLCVVTSAYLRSDWCTAEVGIARSQGSRLLPLQAEAGVVHPLLRSNQYVDYVHDPTSAHASLQEALRRIDAIGSLGWPDGRSPFPGLQPFDVDMHRAFFGRHAEVEALAALLRSPAERGTGALLVIGPSGCGKSSLVRAGLLPVMAAEPDWWRLMPFTPAADPLTSLARELVAEGRRLGMEWSLRQVSSQLDGGELTELAEELLLAASSATRRHHLLLVVDQFEELLSQSSSKRRAQFIDLLSPALRGPVQVVGTVRPEFLSQLLASPELASWRLSTFTLRPLRREALRTVIEGPAQLAGIGVDAELVARLVADTDTGEALPLLAFTLAQLAEGLARGDKMSNARYDQLGGVQGALIRQANAALTEACRTSGRAGHNVVAGLLRLVTVDDLGRPIRWRVRRDELPTQTVAELDAFIARRMVITDTEDGAVVLEVAHEAFLSAWPPLAEAITASTVALRARRNVENAAAEWDKAGCPASRLWEGTQLAAAINDTGARLRPASASRFHHELSDTPSTSPRRPLGRLIRRHRVLTAATVELSPRARNFLHTSIRRERRRRARSTMILSALLVIALAAASIASIQRQAAQSQQRAAITRQLVSEADTVRDTDPRLALLLGIAADNIRSSGETQASLLNTLTATGYAGTLETNSGPVNSIAYSPNGRILVSVGDKTLIVWDVTRIGHPRRLGQAITSEKTPTAPFLESITSEEPSTTSAVFAPNGRILATTREDNMVILWDLTDPTAPHRLSQAVMPTRFRSGLNSVAFSPDGRTLAAGWQDKVSLFDVSDPAKPRPLGPPLTHRSGSGSITAVFAPDGRTLATAGELLPIVTLWDVSDRAHPRQLGPSLKDNNNITSLVFAPNGRTLVSLGTNSLILWDVTNRAKPRRISRFTDNVGSSPLAAFSPRVPILVTTSTQGTVTLRDVENDYRAVQKITGHRGAVSAIAFSPEGETFATGGKDQNVILWNLRSWGFPRRTSSLQIPFSNFYTVNLNRLIYSLALTPDGQTLAAGTQGDTVVLWDVSDRRHPRFGQTLHLGSKELIKDNIPVAIAPDGVMATGHKRGTVILWDMEDPLHPRQLGEPLDTGQVSAVAFAPVGHTLVTASAPADNAVAPEYRPTGPTDTTMLWDVTDPIHPRRLASLTGVHAPQVGPGVDLPAPLAFTHDGRTLATVNGRTVVLWDLSDPANPRRLDPPREVTDTVTALAIAPDGGTLAAGSSDHNVMFWDLSNPARPRGLGQPLTGPAVTGHTAPVSGVAFAPTGRTLATGSEDQIVRLWDLSDRTRPRLIGRPLRGAGHFMTDSSLTFASDGRTLAMIGGDYFAWLFDLSELEDLRRNAVDRACLLTGRGLTPDEWSREIPGLPYRNTCAK
jgi:WD40 repeat protein